MDSQNSGTGVELRSVEGVVTEVSRELDQLMIDIQDDDPTKSTNILIEMGLKSDVELIPFQLAFEGQRVRYTYHYTDPNHTESPPMNNHYFQILDGKLKGKEYAIPISR